MLTDTQRPLFEKVLDLNFQMNCEPVPSKKMELLEQLTQAKINLKNDMGEEAYNNFINQGIRMFAPKKED